MQMKKTVLFNVVMTFTVITMSCGRPPVRTICANDKIIEIEVVSVMDTVINRTSPGTEDNKYGFEGGRVVKVRDTYHLFTAEMYDDIRWVSMRLGHWESKNGIDWRRVGTVRQSDGDHTGRSQRAAIWGPMVVFNDEDNRWHLVYVCYKSKPDEPNAWYLAYDGVIQHAVSTVEGETGIYGPYEDKEILMRYDDNPDDWEGLQGTDSFFPYKIGKKWYAFYGSATTQDVANCEWHIGLAQANRIEGPWKRMSELNPVDVGGFAENPIVMQLDNGVYIAIVDGYFERPGYTLSWDGLHWSNIRYIDMASATDKWWTMMRTPLSLIKEDDGTYTMFFTAYKNYAETLHNAVDEQPETTESQVLTITNDFLFGCVSKAKLKINFINK